MDVLVVGAGPSGLFAASELARYRIPARVVESRPEPHRQARATILQPATLEILAQAGILDPLLAVSMHLPFARLMDAELRVVSEMAFEGAGCPWEFECSLPQWRTEQLIGQRLVELGGQVERGVTVTGLEPRDDGVLVTMQHANGTTEQTETSWVVGAGGAHSITRRSMGEVLEGSTYPGTALVADIRADAPLSRDGSALMATPEGYVLLSPLPEGRWLTFVGDLSGAEATRLQADPSLAAVAASMRGRLGDRVTIREVGWASTFSMHRRLVSRLLYRRRFLLGDAGHLSSPFGGEGLNSGLHDAHNLAWKLALTLRGQARTDLLDTYEVERLQADQRVLEVSDRLHSMALGAVEAARTGVQPPPPTADEAYAFLRSRSMLDVSYVGSPLVGEHAGGRTVMGPSAPALGERHPDRASLVDIRHVLLVEGPADDGGLATLHDRWRGLVDVVRVPNARESSGATALLVRPDGYVGFRFAPTDAGGWAALDEHLARYLIPSVDGARPPLRLQRWG